MNFDIKYTENLKTCNFIKNKTSPGDTVGCTELGTLNKTFKQPWVRYGDTKHTD